MNQLTALMSPFPSSKLASKLTGRRKGLLHGAAQMALDPYVLASLGAGLGAGALGMALSRGAEREAAPLARVATPRLIEDFLEHIERSGSVPKYAKRFLTYNSRPKAPPSLIRALMKANLEEHPLVESTLLKNIERENPARRLKIKRLKELPKVLEGKGPLPELYAATLRNRGDAPIETYGDLAELLRSRHPMRLRIDELANLSHGTAESETQAIKQLNAVWPPRVPYDFAHVPGGRNFNVTGMSSPLDAFGGQVSGAHHYQPLFWGIASPDSLLSFATSKVRPEKDTGKLWTALGQLQSDYSSGHSKARINDIKQSLREIIENIQRVKPTNKYDDYGYLKYQTPYDVFGGEILRTGMTKSYPGWNLAYLIRKAAAQGHEGVTWHPAEEIMRFSGGKASGQRAWYGEGPGTRGTIHDIMAKLSKQIPGSKIRPVQFEPERVAGYPAWHRASINEPAHLMDRAHEAEEMFNYTQDTDNVSRVVDFVEEIINHAEQRGLTTRRAIETSRMNVNKARDAFEAYNQFPQERRAATMGIIRDTLWRRGHEAEEAGMTHLPEKMTADNLSRWHAFIDTKDPAVVATVNAQDAYYNAIRFNAHPKQMRNPSWVDESIRSLRPDSSQRDVGLLLPERTPAGDPQYAYSYRPRLGLHIPPESREAAMRVKVPLLKSLSVLATAGAGGAAWKRQFRKEQS